ncbi:hypothetical protein BJX99DRAFT_40454 [Aspergillus californicus]
MATNRRAARPRSRNGCVTCKIRHVKCDEGKPECLQCQNSGRKCDGYDNASQTELRQRIVERHRPIVRDTFGADHRLVLRQETRTERRYVDFFYAQTSHAFSGFYNSKLWSYLIPQLAEHEPSIRHAMTAIGAIHSRLHNQNSLPSTEDSAPTDRFVLEEYNKSIQNLVKALSSAGGENLHLTLTSCCLFVCLEMLRGNMQESLDHIEAGVRILHKHEQSSPGPSLLSTELYCELRDLFLRLNLQSSFFGRLLIPLKLPSTDTIRGATFTDFSQSRSLLDQLMTKSLLFIRSVGIMREERAPDIQEEFELEQEEIRQDLLAWRYSLDLLVLKHGSKIIPADLCASLLQRVYYHTALLWVLTVLSRDENLYDDFIPDFESVVSYSAEIIRITSSPPPRKEPETSPIPTATATIPDPAFTLDGEIIGPLYYTACRCRHPAIRRRAIELMSGYPKREGMWDARLYYAVSKLVTDVEESPCAVPPTSERDIDGLWRVYEEVQPKGRRDNPTQVILYLKPDGVDGPWKMRSVVVDW